MAKILTFGKSDLWGMETPSVPSPWTSSQRGQLIQMALGPRTLWGSISQVERYK